MTDISDGIQFRRDGVDPNQWPVLSCSQANQLALEVSDLRLDANREILFQGNGQLTASGDMLFLTGDPSSSEKLRILANGNVGIGITAPTEKLEVAGKIKASQLDVTGTVKAATFQGDGSALTGKVSTAGDTITGSLAIQNSLTVSGNVGIGTTTPSYKLAIAAGDINIDDGRALRQAGRWVIGGDSNVLSIGSSDARDGRDISFDPGFSGALTIKKNTGNVGIGTKNPAARLHIFSKDEDALKITNNTLAKTVRMGVDNLGVFIEPSETDTSIRLNANPGLGGLYIRGIDGSVGIGTSVPGTKLEVKGNLTLDTGESPILFTGTGNSEFNRYLQLINSPALGSASGLKAGGILVSDSYAYANPSKNDLIVKGNVGIGTMEILNSLHVARAAHLNAIFDRTDTRDHLTAVVGSDGSGFRFSNSNFFFIGTQPYSERNDNGTGTELLRITSAGSVGIGTANPAYKLDVAGAAHASSFPTSSDIRLKKDITQLTNVLEKLEKIRGVAFEWNELYESLGRSTGHKEIGVTAQEVEAVFPELVTTWGDEGYKAVDYGRLTGVLIEAAKELKAENEALKQRIEALETAIEKT